jgi:acetylornithine aminotransferase
LKRKYTVRFDSSRKKWLLKHDVSEKVLRVFETKEEATRAGALLAGALAATPGVKEVRGYGLLLAAELEGHDAKQVNTELLARGLVANAVSPTAIRFAPPLNVSDDEVAEAVAIFAGVLAE